MKERSVPAQVVVWNRRARPLCERKTRHSHNIFDCAFAPADERIVVTSAADGRVGVVRDLERDDSAALLYFRRADLP